MSNAEFLNWLRCQSTYTPLLEWLSDRDLVTAWSECERADWMIWLLIRTDCGLRVLTAAKAAAAEVARPRMVHPLSVSALDAAHAFGRGEIDEDVLVLASYAACSAASDMACSYGHNDYVSAWAAYAASNPAYSSVSCSEESAYAAALKQAADNIRQIIPDITKYRLI
jgi:hypothetical protein